MIETKTIAVIGGTGKAGRYLINELLLQGYHVRALSRDISKLPSDDKRLTPIQGDVTNPEDILRLLSGCGALLSTLGQKENKNPVFSVATQNIIHAMNLLQIKRYIVLTGLSIDTPDDQKSSYTRFRSRLMRWIYPAIIKDKQREYWLLSDSNLDCTMFRVPFIELNNHDKKLSVSLTDCVGKKVGAASLARLMVAHIDNAELLGKAPFVADKD